MWSLQRPYLEVSSPSIKQPATPRKPICNSPSRKTYSPRKTSKKNPTPFPLFLFSVATQKKYLLTLWLALQERWTSPKKSLQKATKSTLLLNDLLFSIIDTLPKERSPAEYSLHLSLPHCIPRTTNVIL